MPRIIESSSSEKEIEDVEINNIKNIQTSLNELLSTTSNLNKDQIKLLNNILISINSIINKLDKEDKPEFWVFEIKRNSDGLMKTVKAKKG